MRSLGASFADSDLLVVDPPLKLSPARRAVLSQF